MRPRLNWTNAFVLLLGLALLWVGFTETSIPVCTFGSVLAFSAVGMAYQQQWARCLAITALAAFITIAMAHMFLKGFLWRHAFGICGLSLLLWDVWKELRRARVENNRPLVALVQLRRAANNFLTDRKLAEIAQKVWGMEFSTAENDAAKRFVVGRSPAFLVNGPDAVFLVNNFAHAYFEDTEKAAEGMKELRLKHAIVNHTAWLSVDLLRFHDDTRKATEAYPVIGRFFAELMDDDCLAVLCPENGRIVSYEPQVLEQLRSANPLDAFTETPFSPVLEVDDRDPRMTAAVEEARRRWPEFLVAFNSRAGEHFGVKAPVTSGGNTEFIWIELDRVEGGTLHGKLANDPVDLGGLKSDDVVAVNLSELNDWSYICNGVMKGGFTVKALEQISSDKPRT